MGYRDPVAYRTETALDSLRGREDFRLLLLDLAFPVEALARLGEASPLYRWIKKCAVNKTGQKIEANVSSRSCSVHFRGFGCRHSGGVTADTAFLRRRDGPRQPPSLREHLTRSSSPPRSWRAIMARKAAITDSIRIAPAGPATRMRRRKS